MDSLTKEGRSQLMSRVRGKGNKSTELVLVHCLRKGHLNGWRRHVKMLGTPDFVFTNGKLCVFVDGCFWHGCPRCYRAPQTRKKFWSEKINRNRTRDKLVNRELANAGWRVLRIWECQLEKRPDKCVQRIMNSLRPKSKPPLQSRKL